MKRALLGLALLLMAPRVLAEAPDLDTLIVPEPPPLEARKPKEDIRRLLRPEASIIEARNRLDKNIAERSERLVAERTLEKRLTEDLAQETRAFEARSAALEKDRQQAKTRLSLLGRSQRAPALADVLAGPPEERVAGFEARREARALLAAADRERLTRYAAELSAWQVAKADLARRNQNLTRTQATIAHLEQELAWDQEEQAALLAAVVAEPEFYAAYAEEMEKTNEVLAAKVKELAAQAPADRRRMFFQETYGGLGPPIRNYAVVGGYGTRNYKGIVSMWRGAHFVPLREGPEGRTDVRALYWGWVAWTGWLAGLGRVVILDHTMGYMSIYAHLASIDVNVGEKVKTGQPLGAMGDSESFFGKRLYLELRKDGVTTDPLPWIR